MIAIDCSEAMRNGDIGPSRLEAMADSVNLLAGSKTQAHPEAAVGVLNLSESASPRVLVTPTNDLGAVLNAMRTVELGGSADVCSGCAVAQLALKHRQNRSQAQRLVLFVGSQVTGSDKELERMGKRLKKQNVALDVVNFGSESESNQPKLQALVDAANNEDNSHLVTVAQSEEALSDALLSTPVFADAQAAGGGSGFAAAAAAASAAAASNQQATQQGADADGMDIEGVDPNMDPQLAMALRASLQEERARQEQQAREASEQSASQQPGEANGTHVSTSNISVAQQEQQQQQQEQERNVAPSAGTEGLAAEQQAMDMDEDALLQQALQMSMEEGGDGNIGAQQQQQQQHDASSGGDAQMEEAQGVQDSNDEDEDLAMALRMSREGDEGGGNQNSDQGGNAQN